MDILVWCARNPCLELFLTQHAVLAYAVKAFLVLIEFQQIHLLNVSALLHAEYEIIDSLCSN